MADAKALFNRHWKDFEESSKALSEKKGEIPLYVWPLLASIYAACIIAEAIRNTADEADGELKTPK